MEEVPSRRYDHVFRSVSNRERKIRVIKEKAFFLENENTQRGAAVRDPHPMQECAGGSFPHNLAVS